MQELWKAWQVAQLLGCNVKTVYLKAAAGQVPSVRIGGLVRFDPAVITAWLEQQRHGPNPELAGAV